MASIRLTGILLNSLGEVDVGGVITFTHLTTTGETIATTKTQLVIPPNGSYNIEVEYGLIRIDYKTRNTERFVSTVIVNSSSTATSLPELLSATTPVAKPVIIQMQGLVADAVAAETAAGLSADISEAFANQLTTTGLIASSATYAANTAIITKGYSASDDGGKAVWVQNGVTGQTASQSPAQLGDLLLNDANGDQWELIHNGEVFISSIGGDLVSDNSLVYTAYANSDADILNLEAQTWPCSGLDVDVGATRTLLRDNPVKNGSLDCDNRFNNTTTVRTSSIYKKDDIALTQTKSPVIDWDGLGVLWLGTSIPHQAVGVDGYPERFGKKLNCTVYNWSWSGSHAFYDIDGDAFDSGTIRALSMTDADVAAGLALYGPTSAYDDSFNPVTLASEMTAEYRIRDQFIANTINVVMLDHNHNDRLNNVEYVENIKTLTGATVGATTTVAVNNTTGLAVGNGCYLRVVGIDNLDYAAGRITAISGLNVTIAYDSTGFTGSFTSGTLVFVDRNTVYGAWDFLIAYIKNMSIVYGDGLVDIVLCNAPSNYTNNLDPDFPIWNVGRAIAGVAARWNLSYYDVANDLEVTFHDHLTYLPDAVHPSTPATRAVFANHWTKWANGGTTPIRLDNAENIFEGSAAELCQTGIAASGTSAWFFFDILKEDDPTGITTTGTFDVYRGVTSIFTGVTVLFSNISSKRKALVTVSGLSGLTTGENLQLRFGSTASITFN